MLLQLRSRYVHHGGTWSVPGGALDRGETPVTAALREAREEIGLDARAVAIAGRHETTCGGWLYTTVIGVPTAALELRPNYETAGLEWVPVAEVDALPLHRGFRAAWENGLAGRG